MLAFSVFVLAHAALLAFPEASAFYLPVRKQEFASPAAVSGQHRSVDDSHGPHSRKITDLPALIAPMQWAVNQLAPTFPVPSAMSYNMGRKVLTGNVNVYHIYYGRCVLPAA